MKRVIAIVVSAGVMGVLAGSASAQPGNFPEQPGTHVQTACVAVSNSAAATAPMAGVAFDITNALFADACTFDS
jgi:hypothetical protein